MSNNINLLPEKMRERDLREMKRAARRPKVFTIDLSAGHREKLPAPIKPPHQSLWAKTFGPKKLAAPVANGALRPQLAPQIAKPLISPKPIIKYGPISSQPPILIKPKRSFWSSIGPAKSPLKPLIQAQAVSTLPAFKLPAQAAKPARVDLKYSQARKKRGLGFFASLKNLFQLRKKYKKYAIIPLNSEEKKLLIEPIAPSKAMPQLPVKTKTLEKYHTAPKAVKSQLDINLVPEELLFRQYSRSQQQIVAMILAIIIPALVVTAAYLFLNQQQKVIEGKIYQLSRNQSQLVAYISGFKDIRKKNIGLQDKLLVISQLLEKHIYWTKFFGLLEKYTLDNVYYTEFTADTSGRFILPAVATAAGGQAVEERGADSYRQAAQQIVALKQAADFVNQLKVNNLEIVTNDKAGFGGIKFDINLDLADGVFIAENK